MMLVKGSNMPNNCTQKDCAWFNNCVVSEPRDDCDCFAIRDIQKPEPVLKKIMIIRSVDKNGNKQKAICETRTQLTQYIENLPEPAGFMNIMFMETGVILTATRSTFIKAANNGTLFEQGSNR